MAQVREWIDLASQGIEALAVAIMVCFIVIETARWLFHSVKGIEGTYERYRLMLGKTLQVGLELLVAADIIRTIALDLTLLNIGLLGGLVVVRTLIGWTLAVEVEGHWPWQPAKNPGPDPGRGLRRSLSLNGRAAASDTESRQNGRGLFPWTTY